MSTIKKVIIILSAILVFLLIIFVAVSRFSVKNTFRQITPLASPTPVINDSQSQTLKRDSFDSLSPPDKLNLARLEARLPVQSESFDLVYSQDLNRILASVKKPEGYTALENFLKLNGVLDLYKNSTAIIAEELPIDEIATETKYWLEESASEEDNPIAPSTSTDDNQKLLTDLLKILLNPDSTTETAPTSPKQETPSTSSSKSCSAGKDAGNSKTFKGTTVHLCRVGGILINSTIAESLNKLLTDARSQGIALSGWGFRSYGKQVALRREHCGSSDYDIYQKPSGQCSPPTARPGHSMHEQGMAIDFTSGGSTLSRGSRAFVWLTQNASKYGLRNLPREAWHWSANGR